MITIFGDFDRFQAKKLAILPISDKEIVDFSRKPML
jgi:hypothetical protein